MANHADRTIIATFLIVAAWSSNLTVVGQKPPARSRSSAALPLNIGGASLRIGMPRLEAMELIGRCCTSSPLSDSMFIMDKNSNDIIGDIFFKDGRVRSLRRHDKHSQHKEASDFMLAVYRSVLERNTSVQSLNVTLSAFSEEMANATKRHLLLTFPNGRKLRISQTSVDTGELVVDLEEER